MGGVHFGFDVLGSTLGQDVLLGTGWQREMGLKSSFKSLAQTTNPYKIYARSIRAKLETSQTHPCIEKQLMREVYPLAIL